MREGLARILENVGVAVEPSDTLADVANSVDSYLIVTLASRGDADAFRAWHLSARGGDASPPTVLVDAGEFGRDLSNLVKRGGVALVEATADPDVLGVALQALDHGLVIMPVLPEPAGASRDGPSGPLVATGDAEGAPRPDVLAKLSKREFEVLRLLAQGLMDKVIGRDLGISERTVRAHVREIFRKLDVSNRTQAALVYVGAARG